MINKKNLWFLTLFSLVLVLSIYYVTMPNELLEIADEISEEESQSVVVSESDIIETMKIDDNEEVNKQIEELEDVLMDLSISTDEKNAAYEQLKSINENSGIEEKIEKSINEEYGCNTFTKINDKDVRVVVDGCDNSKSLANNIMRLVQEQFDSKMYISVQFK